MLARQVRRRQRPARWGNLRRRSPFSDYWGFDRGVPIDRFYIETFLSTFAADVSGRVLEVREGAYTRRFGGTRVTASDVLDVDETNEAATIIADLGVPGSLPAARFDCLLITQTLQYLDDPAVGVWNLWQALAPRGTLLISVPCVQRIDPEWTELDRWRFTPRGLEDLLKRSCPTAEVEVIGYGNSVATIAFVMGIAAEELRRRELEESDPAFPLVVCARVGRPTQPPA